MDALRVVAAAAWVVACGGAAAQVSVFDAATNLVTIPSVAVGDSTYTGVTLRHQGNYVFSLQGATQQLPAGPGVARYDLASNLLTIPAVKVGSATFVDVKLLNTGNFTFALQAAGELPAATVDAVKSFFAAYDAQWASAVPSTGAARTLPFDDCYRGDGRTKAWLTSEVDADSAAFTAREAHQIGRQTVNLQVVSVRSSPAPDGTREEFDVQYDVVFRDGTTVRTFQSTLVRGSTAGIAGCTAPQNTSALRFFGNRRLVAVDVRSRNVRDERHSISSGAALSPAVNYRRVLQWQITDPLANAAYVVVTGPGPGGALGEPFSLKFISPRLLSTAAELRGKAGNFLNWRDDDGFRYCRVAGSGTPLATLADCAGQGASAFEFGITTPTPNAAADQSFVDQGWVAGGVYRFDVYNDDGWKTVNGHAGKTPIGTYYETLGSLPYSFVEMAGSGTGADKFPRLTFASMSAAQVAANANAATPAAMNVSWNPPGSLADGRKFSLGQGWDFHQGPKVGNTGTTLNPGYRSLLENYPGSAATANPAWLVAPKVADQASKSYVEFTLFYTDRNSGHILSLYSLQ